MEITIKDEWYEIVSKHEEFSAEEIYTLLSPDNNREFFDILNRLEYKEKLIGVKYLIVHKKSNQNYVTILPQTSPQIIPDSVPFPYSPNIPITNPLPYRPEIWAQSDGTVLTCYNGMNTNQQYPSYHTTLTK